MDLVPSAHVPAHFAGSKDYFSARAKKILHGAEHPIEGRYVREDVNQGDHVVLTIAAKLFERYLVNRTGRNLPREARRFCIQLNPRRIKAGNTERAPRR